MTPSSWSLHTIRNAAPSAVSGLCDRVDDAGRGGFMKERTVDAPSNEQLYDEVQKEFEP